MTGPGREVEHNMYYSVLGPLDTKLQVSANKTTTHYNPSMDPSNPSMHAEGLRSPVSPTSPTVMRQRREALYPHNKPPPKLDLFSFNEDED